MLGTVIAHHQGQIQLSRPLRRDRHADQAAGFCGEEVDDLRRRFLCGDDQVALVLTVLIVHEDDHTTGADVIE